MVIDQNGLKGFMAKVLCNDDYFIQGLLYLVTLSGVKHKAP